MPFTASTTTAPAAAATKGPVPDVTQRKVLFVDLAKIDPAYTGGRAANAAMKVCHSILSESKEPLQIAAAQSGFGEPQGSRSPTPRPKRLSRPLNTTVSVRASSSDRQPERGRPRGLWADRVSPEGPATTGVPKPRSQKASVRRRARSKPERTARGKWRSSRCGLRGGA